MFCNQKVGSEDLSFLPVFMVFLLPLVGVVDVDTRRPYGPPEPTDRNNLRHAISESSSFSQCPRMT